MTSFLEASLVGAGLAISLAAPPGPILAKVAFEVSRGRPWTGFFVGLGASCADLTFFFLVAFGLLKVPPNPRALGILGLLGVVVMDLFAVQAWRDFSRGGVKRRERRTGALRGSAVTGVQRRERHRSCFFWIAEEW